MRSGRRLLASIWRGPAAASLCVSMLLSASTSRAEDRSIDGTGNHPADLGKADSNFLRLGKADYDDGISTLAGQSRPNPRVISNNVFAQTGEVPEPGRASGFVFQWGQFLDHDIDIAHTASPVEAADIAIPSGDPVFPTDAVIPLERSAYDPDTGTSKQNPRQQRNAITSFIDASNVYGSDDNRALVLRTLTGGRLKTSTHDLLPFNTSGEPNAGGPDPTLYLAGDERANEQVGLTAMHVLFLREHNRQADAIAANNPNMSDEEIYQAARARVGALLQVITYKEFLPVVLGENALAPYTDYDSNVDPSISNEFATAAYRFGHSMISPVLYRLKVNGQSIPEGPLSLREAFFTRNELDPDQGKGIEPLLRGLALVPSQAVDTLVVDDVRNFLFGEPSDGGVDLVALNIQRGRDHGLLSYADMRKQLKLPQVKQFSDVSSDAEVQVRLAATYDKVDDIDLWVGGLAEDHQAGALVGPTVRAILLDQFTRLRDGDRFWYQRVFSDTELAELESTTLRDVIVRNTKIKVDELQSNVFRVPEPS